VAAQLLLADDSITIQRVVQLTFAGEDVEVVTVSDGDQAIAQLDERPPDIVLADVAMPGRNGYEVAAYMRRTARLAHIPVLLLTGGFEPIDQRLASEVRCAGVLAKPFEPQAVVERVKELLTLGRDAAPPIASSAPAQPQKTDAPMSPDAVGEYFDRLDAAFSKLPGRNAAGPVTPALTPSSPISSTSPITDDLVDRVADRVLQRLSDRIGRDVVADLVSTIAERLVRDEIERIKAALR
jgi:CheY-like chemotaxis protein